jgi:hypothetical protein
MTYIITPKNCAFHVSDPAFMIHECDNPGQKPFAVVQITHHKWSSDWDEISTRFTGVDRMFAATEFLMQLIEALSENPLIIHCNEFGNMKIIKTPNFKEKTD